MPQRKIIIKGAREHNLKDIHVEIPRDKLIIVTGLSGSGKSSLAFDTLYAEGQRRYVESLSAYARQFLDQMDKPDVDAIEGLSPAISIEQRTVSKNPRSTVGTVTEIYDHLRLLFARAGEPHCHECKLPIRSQTVQQMVDRVMALPSGVSLQVLAPIVRGRKGEYRKELNDMLRRGFLRVRVDGALRELDEEIRLAKNKKHTIEVVVDRIKVRPGIEGRLADSLETSLRHAGGLALIAPSGMEELLFSSKHSCPRCGLSFPELAPRMFSFNSPYGACPHCDGLGVSWDVDPELVVPDRELSLREGALRPWAQESPSRYRRVLERFERELGVDLDRPFGRLPKSQQKLILHGGNGRLRKRGEFEGVVPELRGRWREWDPEEEESEVVEYMRMLPCPACRGARLKPESLAVRVGGLSIADITRMPIKEASGFFDGLHLPAERELVAERILKEIRERLEFLRRVGLDYLTLDRPAATLAGGEGQRIKLATQIGASLVGVLYILDEPSIGLHQRDNRRLLDTLERLRDMGNTVIVVEHDRETILTGDWVLDLGPGAGAEGGYLVAQGTPQEIMKVPGSLTGRYLSGKLDIPIPSERRRTDGQFLTILKASEHNLKNIDVGIPLGLLTCITGVSGSGKSTLVSEILYRALARKLYRSPNRPGRHKGLRGAEAIDKVIEIDQSPIGRTPRSNPATYTGVFTEIRELFSLVPESRKRGYRPGRFSFNVSGGRCEACQGQGLLKIEMHFLPDLYVTCQVCKGRRFNRETMEVKYKGKSVAEVLDMTVDAALDFFESVPALRWKLKTLKDVGLGYIRLGQPATTLSGGEAQRVKLSRELSKRETGRTLYILDEPTTGLHFADIEMLLSVLRRLTEGGNTVIVIEHNMDVIKTADYIIDLGPEGGDEGGEIVAQGSPEEVAEAAGSHTGRYLRKVLGLEGR